MDTLRTGATHACGDLQDYPNLQSIPAIDRTGRFASEGVFQGHQRSLEQSLCQCSEFPQL